MKFGPILIFQNLFAFEIGRHITFMLFEKNSMITYMYFVAIVCTYYIHETSKIRQIFRGKIPLFLVLYIHAQVFNKGSQWKHSCLCGRPHELSKYILKTDSEKIVESRVTNHYVLFLLRFLMNQSLSNCSLHPLRNDYTLIKLYSLYLAQL